MVATGDIIQVKAHQTLGLGGPSMMNVYYFVVTSADAGANLNNQVPVGAGNDFVANYLAGVRGIQTTSIYYTLVEFNNLSDYVDEFAQFSPTSSNQGAISGEFMSTQDAWSFLLVRSTRATRHGHKRIGGVPEAAVTNGVIDAGFNTQMAAAVAALRDSWDYNPTPPEPSWSMSPVIVKSPILPPAVPTVINPIISVDYRGVGSQNTRKRSFS